MAKEKKDIGSSWEDLALPKYFPEPYTEERAEEEEEEEDTEEAAKDSAVKCSPTLLRMLKAAESRWTPRDRDKAEPSKLGRKVSEAEALKTNMVSKELFFNCLLRIQ